MVYPFFSIPQWDTQKERGRSSMWCMPMRQRESGIDPDRVFELRNLTRSSNTVET